MIIAVLIGWPIPTAYAAEEWVYSTPLGPWELAFAAWAFWFFPIFLPVARALEEDDTWE